MVEKSSLSKNVLVVDDLNVCDEQLSVELVKYHYEVVVLGLDCEWVTHDKDKETVVSPVALLQLAFPNGKCFLVRLCRMNGRLPGKLKDILEDRSHLKVGVGISEDCKKLSQCYGVVVQGCIDLRHVASRCRAYVQYCFSEEGHRDNMSLSSLSQQILGVTLDKDWKIRCSDWEADNLSERQVEYAANDAVIAEKIFFMLLASKLKEKEDRFEAGSQDKESGIQQDLLFGSEELNNSQKSEGGLVVSASEPSLEDEDASERTSDCVMKSSQEFLCTSTSLSIDQEAEKDLQVNVDNSLLGRNSDSKTTPASTSVSILSGLISKLSSVSLDSIIGKPSKSESAQKSKGVVYNQYASFKKLEVSEALLASQVIWGCLSPLCQGIVDLPYKTKLKQKNKLSGNEKGKQTNSPQVKHKASGLKPRRAPLYQNCVLEAPDGEMLSTCDKRKAEWYLVRELAVVVKEDPYTVRLKFEPSGRPQDPEHNYYLTFKENMCVVCGRDDSYMRKNIIPHDYRKNFPVCMKDHHSHDVLLLCPPCHMVSCNHDDMLRKYLARKYDAPLASAQVARLIQDPVLKKVKSAAKALVCAGEKIPEKRRDELLSVVKEFLGDENFTEEMLIEAAALEIRRENCDFVSHGREVVRKVRETGELLSFERMWREHFLATMKPKYLPPLWTVDHEQEKMKKLLQLELSVKESKTM